MKIRERNKNTQLAINMTASFTTFIVSLGISFFLTPFIVRSLGAAAYGFVGLSANIISYTQLLTIALNSMAARFISIKYTQGKFLEANKYFSSVLYGNIAISVVLLILMLLCVIYIEYIFEIPDNFVTDVKILFSLLSINTIIGLITNVYAVSTFIKNKLELSSIRSIIANFIRAISLVLLFGFLTPKLWYIGIGGMFATLYSSYTNYQYTNLLTPELVLKKANFDLRKIKELIAAGAWNVLSKISEILGTGLDLVLANIFIGATAMGIFSITKTIPVQILAIFATISSVFAPNFTALYANDKRSELLNELFKSIRVLGFLITAPLACLYVLGEDFYRLWLPTEDATLLQVLTVVGTLGLSFAMPLEALWNIFTITNKIKFSSYVTLLNNVIIFLIVMCSMLFVESDYIKLLILAGTRTCTGIIRVIIFLPIYGAYCLNLPRKTFYPNIVKSVSSVILTTIVCYLIKFNFVIDTWVKLFVGGILVAGVSLGVNYYVVLNQTDRILIKKKLLRKS